MQEIKKQGQNQNLTKLNLDYSGTKDGEDQAQSYLNMVDEKNWICSKCFGCIC